MTDGSLPGVSQEGPVVGAFCPLVDHLCTAPMSILENDTVTFANLLHLRSCNSTCFYFSFHCVQIH